VLDEDCDGELPPSSCECRVGQADPAAPLGAFMLLVTTTLIRRRRR